eukprot:IDg22347t1
MFVSETGYLVDLMDLKDSSRLMDIADVTDVGKSLLKLSSCNSTTLLTWRMLHSSKEVERTIRLNAAWNFILPHNVDMLCSFPYNLVKRSLKVQFTLSEAAADLSLVELLTNWMLWRPL